MTDVRSQMIYAVRQDQDANPEPLEKLVAEVGDLRARNNKTYCAYCGYTVPLDAEDAESKVYDHISACPYHPLNIKLQGLEERLKASVEMAYEAAQGATREACAIIAENFEHTCSCHTEAIIADRIRAG